MGDMSRILGREGGEGDKKNKGPRLKKMRAPFVLRGRQKKRGIKNRRKGSRARPSSKKKEGLAKREKENGRQVPRGVGEEDSRQLTERWGRG